MKLIYILIGLLLILPAPMAYGGGTEDINIGVGELQESSAPTRAIQATPTTTIPHRGPGDLQSNEEEQPTGLLLPAVQKPRSSYGSSSKSKKGGKVETQWKVEEGEK